MEKNKIFSISIICLAVSLVISAVILSHSIKEASLNLQIGLNGIQTGNAPASSYTDIDNNYKDAMSIYDAAQYLGVSQEELEQLIITKKIDIPVTKINKNYVFSKNAINKWLEKSHTIN